MDVEREELVELVDVAGCAVDDLASLEQLRTPKKRLGLLEQFVAKRLLGVPCATEDSTHCFNLI